MFKVRQERGPGSDEVKDRGQRKPHKEGDAKSRDQERRAHFPLHPLGGSILSFAGWHKGILYPSLEEHLSEACLSLTLWAPGLLSSHKNPGYNGDSRKQCTENFWGVSIVLFLDLGARQTGMITT